MLAVNKPAGLLVEHSPHYPSVEDWAGQHVRTQPGKNFIGIVHRLDRAVSGALVLAKRKSTLRELHGQFARREVGKFYWAITAQAPAAPAGTLVHWLRKDQPGKRALLFDQPQPGATEVGLNYRVLQSTTAGHLWEIELLTGKFHQIRAQLAAIGCSILGDVRYGAARPYRREAIALHARRLIFTDPLTGGRVEAIAPAPADDTWRAFSLTQPSG